MEILVISPHMDDEVLGCGGVISKHKQAGDNVSVIFIAHRIYEHQFDETRNKLEEKQTLKAKEILGYDEAIFLRLNDERLYLYIQEMIISIEKHIEKIKPEVVYIPFNGDNNQDHRATFDATRVALRPSSVPFVKQICMYEVPSSTEQSPPLAENTFRPNYFVDIEEHIDKKIEALNCYQTEKRNYPHPRSEEAIKVLSQNRGVSAGFIYAEGFMLMHKKWS